MKIRVVIEEVVVDIETPDTTYTSTCRDWLKDAVNQAAEKAIELHNARMTVPDNGGKGGN